MAATATPPRARGWRRVARTAFVGGSALLTLAALGLGAVWLRYRAIVSALPDRGRDLAHFQERGRWVNPFIGTGGVPWVCGHNFPGAMTPLGMVRLGPETISMITHSRALNTSGYYYGDDQLLGFSHTRLNGTGATDGGHFLVTPAREPRSEKEATTPKKIPFSHRNESADPGSYRIDLPEPQVRVELTATPRVGLHRYTFEGPRPIRLRFDAANALGGKRATEASIRLLPGGRELEGSVKTFGTFAGRYGGLRVYFCARLQQPAAGSETWVDGGRGSNVASAEGTRASLDLEFAPQSDGRPRVVELALAISHVSIANARGNLDAETARAGFDILRERARRAWETRLASVTVEGGEDRERTLFHTALYRAFQMPTLFNDVNGDYVGLDHQVHRVEQGSYYTDLSLWDTFRTVHPLYTLIAPDDQRDMIRSLMRMMEQGGWFPRWPSGHGYSNSMLGTPADIVIAEAWLKGLRGFDIEAAYQAMRRTALAATPRGAAFSGREGVEYCIKHGYCPDDLMEESVARTFEFGWADHALAELADALGKTNDATLFLAHSRFFTNLWNPTTRFFQGRRSSGAFVEPLKPELLTYLDSKGKYTKAYVEGSAWQWRWGAPYDSELLIHLFGGREAFVNELSAFFERSDRPLGSWNPGPYYWHGNQPDIHAAYLFNEAGRPDLTQKWSRWILDTKYADTHDGLDGNDDGGTLSAWYVFGALGLYPVAGTDRYQLGAPLFRKATLRLGTGVLEIETKAHGKEQPYARAVRLNGRLLDRWWIRHAEIASGGRLEFEMSQQPPPQ